MVLEWLGLDSRRTHDRALETNLRGPAGGAGLLEQREPIELATAALLIELARSDFSESTAELDAIRQLLRKRFGLDAVASKSCWRKPGSAPTTRFRCMNSRIG